MQFWSNFIQTVERYSHFCFRALFLSWRIRHVFKSLLKSSVQVSKVPPKFFTVFGVPLIYIDGRLPCSLKFPQEYICSLTTTKGSRLQEN